MPNADLLKILRGNGGKGVGELRTAQAVTTDPDPVTFIVEGTDIALDADIFTIPLSVYPICKGDTFYVLPIAGSDNQRWGIISKINNTNAVGTMTGASSCRVTGIGRDYTANDLIIPPYVAKSGSQTTSYTRPLQTGDRVILFPVAVNGVIKYAIANYY